MTDTPPRRRWLRWVLLAGVALVVGLVLLWRNQPAHRDGQAALDAALAETDAADARWRWEDLVADRPTVPERRDPRPIVQAILANPPRKPGVQDPSPPSRGFFPGDLPANCLLDTEAVEYLDDTLDGRDQIVTLALSLRNCPRGNYPVVLRPDPNSTSLPQIEGARRATWWLALDAERQLHRGRALAAAERIEVMLNATAVLRDEPILLSQLVRMSLRRGTVSHVERLLAMSEPDDATLARLQKRLAEEATDLPLVIALRGERACQNLFFENLRNGKIPPKDWMHAEDGYAPDDPAIQNQLCRQHARALRCMNEAIEIGSLPFPQPKARWNALSTTINTPRPPPARSRFDVRTWLGRDPKAGPARYEMMAAGLMFGVFKMAEVAPEEHADLVCGQVALACERYRQANKHWPWTLDDLVPAYLPAIPSDPYTGAPLLYKAFADGVAVYTTGANGVDDGGLILRGGDRATGDRGLRLWDPRFRRLPPPPNPDDNGEDPLVAPPEPIR
jgi:hypothetical protein